MDPATYFLYSFLTTVANAAGWAIVLVPAIITVRRLWVVESPTKKRN